MRRKKRDSPASFFVTFSFFTLFLLLLFFSVRFTAPFSLVYTFARLSPRK